MRPKLNLLLTLLTICLLSGLDVSYSTFNLKPVFGKSYSIPPKIAVSPENQFLKENAPPWPKALFLFLKLSSNRMVDKNQDSASNTLESILINIKRNNSEEEYFNILKKYSNGQKLSDQEKSILKNFKK